MLLNILNLWQAKNLNRVIGGRYKLVKKLGEGGFGQTFVAEDVHLPGKPKCVVKLLKPQISDAFSWQTARRLFDAEAVVLSELGKHDQIPRLLAHFEENKEFYLVQELIEGHLIAQELVSGQPWSEIKVIALLKDLLEVLTFVHQQQVIHRDIKPENLIRRNSDGKIVLIDFGAVKQVGSQPQSNKQPRTNLTISIGTQGYMPKEQLGGNPRFSSDVYAVGIIGIQALIGIHPKFWTEDAQTGEINWREFVAKSVNPQLIELLDRMIRYDFRTRYNTAGQALDALRKLPSKLMEMNSPSQPSIKLNKNFLFSKSQPVTKQPTVMVQEQNQYPPSHRAPGPSWRESIPNLPINYKHLALGLSALGVAFLFLKIVPTFHLDPETRKFAMALKEGDEARQNGNYEKALAAYQEAISAKNDRLEGYAESCLTLSLMGRYEEAIASCDRALAINSKSPQALEAKGFAFEQQKKYGEALNFYALALEHDPKYAEAWKRKGVTLLALNVNPEQALSAFDKAIELQSNLAEAHWGRCQSLNLLDKYNKALESCNRALELAPKYPQAFYSKGFALEKQQKFSEALEAYEKALEIAPKYTQAWTHKGIALLSLNRPPKEAQSAFERAIELDPNLSEAYWGRCQSLNLLQQYDGAIPACDRALQLQPKYARALYSKGFALEKLRKYPDALNSYDLALTIESEYPEALNRRGFVQIALNRPQEALKAFERTIELQPKLAEAHWGQCESLNLLQQYDRAIAACDKALSLAPDYAAALTSKGFSLKGKGKPQEALALYEEALKIDPNYARAWNNKAVTLLAMGREIEEVKQAYDKALSLDANLAEAHWGRCFIHNLRGQHQEAIAACDRAIAIKPTYARALWSKGFALDEQKNHTEALKLYDRAIASDPKFAEAWNNKGTTLITIGGNPQDILYAFDRAVEYKPQFAQAWINRGVALWRFKRLEEAVASLEQGFKLDPDAPNRKELLERARAELKKQKG